MNHEMVARTCRSKKKFKSFERTDESFQTRKAIFKNSPVIQRKMFKC